MSIDKKERGSLRKPIGPEGTPNILRRVRGTVREAIGKIFKLGDTVNVIVDGQIERGVIAAFSISPYKVEKGEGQDEVDFIAVNIKGFIMDVVLRDLLAANPGGPISRCKDLRCAMESTEESKTHDVLVDSLEKNGLFDVETTYFAERGNKVFFIGHVLGNGIYLNVIAVVADGLRRIPRLFYKSHSHAAWRVSPTLEVQREGSIFYDKGNELFDCAPDEFSYTQTTRVQRELARMLDKLAEEGQFRKIERAELYAYFDKEVLRKQREYHPVFTARDDSGGEDRGIDTFYLETKEFDFFDDEKKKDAVGAYKVLDLSRYERYSHLFPDITRPVFKRRIEISDLNESLEKDDRLETQFPGFVPEFTRANLLVAYERHHHLLGKYTVEVYETHLIDVGGVDCRFEWEMAYDEEGRVWIEGIDLAEPNFINSYGTYGYFINSGLLTQKPFEYKDTVSWLNRGEHYKYCGDSRYYDVTPLLDHLQPVRKFRFQRGIYRPPNKKSPPSKELPITKVKAFKVD